MSGLRVAAGSFFCNLLAMLLTLLVAQSCGLLLGATMSSMRTSLAVATIFMLCVMLVGGFYVQNIPVRAPPAELAPRFLLPAPCDSL
jgi:hypothetical protein